MEQSAQRPQPPLSEKQWPVAPTHEPVDSYGRQSIETPAATLHRTNAHDISTVGRGSRLSPDEVEAVQALKHLRTDAVHPPKRQRNGYSSDLNTEAALYPSHPAESSHDPEPLLSLLTSQHPYLSSAINVPLSAYSSTKSYSRSFKYGAELVERHIGSPVASTVNTASRITGVETGVRWWLQKPGSPTSERRSKRRRTKETHDDPSNDMDVEQGLISDPPGYHSVRRTSNDSLIENLPPYDDQQAPSYQPQDPSLEDSQNSTAPSDPSWQMRIVTSTSGLSVALSEESLRSLRYCLSWLKGVNSYVSRMIINLRDAIRELDSPPSDPAVATQPTETSTSSPNAKDKSTIVQRVRLIKTGILQALDELKNVVSRYAGNALPANAQRLIRGQITTFKYRYSLAWSAESNKAQQSPNPPGIKTAEHAETERSRHEITTARQVLVLASEGLDMIAQISGVIDGTITSAEDWLSRFGGRGQQRQGGSMEQSPQQHERRDEKKGLVWDEKMGVLSLEDMKAEDEKMADA
ncbi:MAG: hypothetical protein Q9174_001222 [Haloplaca sp. 1 TL-2023]